MSWWWVFEDKIMFSDEAHLHLNGFFVKQNWEIQAFGDAKVYEELLTYPRWVAVWCEFWTRELIGPYFFENGHENAVTVNGIPDCEMVSNFLCHEINDVDVEDVVSTTSHITNETMRFSGDLVNVHWSFTFWLLLLAGSMERIKRITFSLSHYIFTYS